MMLKRVLTILFVFFYSVIFAWEPDSTVNPKFILKTPVLSYIDFFGGLSYRLGAEIKLYDNISSSLEIGKYFRYQTDNRKGGIVRAELKFYEDDEICIGNYFSVEYLYKNTTFNFTDSFAIPLKPRYEKEYIIHKEISCLTLKYGELEIYKNRFVFEWYAGIGIRFYSKAYNNLTNEENIYMLTGEGHGDIVGKAIRLVGMRVTPNLNAGIKIGYLIKY